MKLFTKIAALFSPPPAPPLVPPLYPDAEFLEVMMQQARQKTRDEQVAHAASSPTQKATV